VPNVLGGDHGNTLTGSAQGSILVGGAGNDTISGGGGRSILIGGAGSDTISDGGEGQDILIGGTVAFGPNLEVALQAILNEWQRTDESFQQQVSNIRNGGGLNGSYKLIWGSTVLDDGNGNTLIGSPSSTALDWFFAGPQDVLINWNPLTEPRN
jgi:hypothetical protein